MTDRATDRPVLFFDSGVGGIPYLKRLKEFKPGEECIYVADGKNFPYGDRDIAEVRGLVVRSMETLLDRFRPKAAVIACNTASVAALSTLREKFSIPFVGVVPAVKPAAEQSARRTIGVFATSRTVEDAYTRNLIRNYASDCRVYTYPGSDTVTYVEERYLYETEEERTRYVRDLCAPFLRDGIDTLVLGCTHFVYLAELFTGVLGEDVRIVESREGVCRQIVRVLERNNLSARPGAGSDVLYTTDGSNRRGRLLADFCRDFGIEYGGGLNVSRAAR
jgi:glutamate racemase